MMGIGNSTLNGGPSRAWWDAWPQTTSASGQQRARREDEFEGAEPGQEEPVPPVTVAQVQAFEEEQAARQRGPHPDTLPMPWPATAFQLWANLSQTAGQVRLAPVPNQDIRLAPAGRANNAGGRPGLSGPWSNGTLPANGAASSSGKWHTRDGVADGSPPEPPSLNDLPPELIGMIAEHLPGEDIGRLRQANRRLHAAVTQEDQAGRLARQAQRVTWLTEFQALLGAPDEGMAVIRDLRMSLQVRPLVALINRIRVLPDSARLTAFKLIHDAVTAATFPLEHRAAPLAELAQQIEYLNAGDRLAAFKLIRDAVTAASFPMERRTAPLAELARQIEYLNGGDRLTAFKLIHDAVTAATFPMERRAAPLAELARQIRDLNAGDRLTAFNLIHDAVTAVTFPLEHRAAPLARLAWRIPDLPVSGRQSAYGRILAAVAGLARQNRGTVLETLATAIIHLPEPARRSTLDATLAAIAELDLLDSGAPLDALALSLSFLLTSDPSEALRRFVAQIDWLPDDRRAQMLGAIR